VTVLFMDLCQGMMICERSKEDGASNNTAAAVHQHKWTHRTMITVKRKHLRFPIVTNVTDFSLDMPQHFIAPSLAFRNNVLRFYLGSIEALGCVRVIGGVCFGYFVFGYDFQETTCVHDQLTITIE
jgi:hypothetical protein